MCGFLAGCEAPPRARLTMLSGSLEVCVDQPSSLDDPGAGIPRPPRLLPAFSRGKHGTGLEGSRCKLFALEVDVGPSLWDSCNR